MSPFPDEVDVACRACSAPLRAPFVPYAAVFVTRACVVCGRRWRVRVEPWCYDAPSPCATLLELPLTPEDYHANLRELRTLAPGWFWGLGGAFADAHLGAMGALLDALVARGLPAPRVFPSPDGELRAEWPVHRVDDRALDLSLSLAAGGEVYGHCADVAPRATDAWELAARVEEVDRVAAWAARFLTA